MPTYTTEALVSARGSGDRSDLSSLGKEGQIIIIEQGRMGVIREI